MRKTLLFSLILLTAIVPEVIAQEKKSEAGEKKPGASYFKFELSGTQTEVYQFDMRSRSLGIELEKNFSKNKPFRILSGFGFGYRREKNGIVSRGHYFNGRAFRNFPSLLGIQPRAGIGYEYGFPALNLDKTLFLYRNNELIEYTAVYPERISNLPTIRTSQDTTGHIFGEASLSIKTGVFVFEGGIRGTRMIFGYENFKMKNGDVVSYTSSRRVKIIPSVFARIGIRIPG